jgi:hypothetical protein
VGALAALPEKQIRSLPLAGDDTLGTVSRLLQEHAARTGRHPHADAGCASLDLEAIPDSQRAVAAPEPMDVVPMEEHSSGAASGLQLLRLLAAESSLQGLSDAELAEARQLASVVRSRLGNS